MNKKVFFSLMMSGFIGLAFVAPSFAQTEPTQPMMNAQTNAADDTDMAAKDKATGKIKTQHKHHKGAKKGAAKHHAKKAHKKAEAEKTTDVMTNTVNN